MRETALRSCLGSTLHTVKGRRQGLSIDITLKLTQIVWTLKCSPATDRRQPLPSYCIIIILFLQLGSPCLSFTIHNNAIMYVQDPWVKLHSEQIQHYSKTPKGVYSSCTAVEIHFIGIPSHELCDLNLCFIAWGCYWSKVELVISTAGCSLSQQTDSCSSSHSDWVWPDDLMPCSPLPPVCTRAVVATHVVYHQNERRNTTFIFDHSGTCYEKVAFGSPNWLFHYFFFSLILSLCGHGRKIYMKSVCFRFVTEMKKPLFSL